MINQVAETGRVLRTTHFLFITVSVTDAESAVACGNVGIPFCKDIIVRTGNGM